MEKRRYNNNVSKKSNGKENKNNRRNERVYSKKEEEKKSISDNMYEFTGNTEKQSYIYGRNAVRELLDSRKNNK